MGTYAEHASKQARRTAIGWLVLLGMPGAMGWSLLLTAIALDSRGWADGYVAGLAVGHGLIAPVLAAGAVFCGIVAVARLRKRHAWLDVGGMIAVVGLNVSYALLALPLVRFPWATMGRA
jgi:hypothetical protein